MSHPTPSSALQKARELAEKRPEPSKATEPFYTLEFFNSVWEHFPSIHAELERVTAENERLKVQLAGCSVAAKGYATGENDCKKGDYGWSQSFEDVKELYENRHSVKVTPDFSIKGAQPTKLEQRFEDVTAERDVALKGYRAGKEFALHIANMEHDEQCDAWKNINAVNPIFECNCHCRLAKEALTSFPEIK